MKTALLVGGVVLVLGSRVHAQAAAPAAEAKPAVEPAKAWKTNPNGTVTVDDAQLGFKLVLPKGTKEAPGVAGNMVYSFFIGDQPNAITVMVQRMKAKIPRQFTKAEAEKTAPKLPANITLVPLQWNGLDLMAMRVEQKAPQGVTIVDYGAQVPLAREGIILHVAAAVEKDEQVKKTLKELLDVLVGEAAPR